MPTDHFRAESKWQMIIDRVEIHSSILEEFYNLLCDPPDMETIDPIDASLRYEAWVRGYLEDVGSDYGIEIHGNLDEKAPYQQRGDVKAMHEGKEVIIEVERQVKTLFEHDHRTEGQRGWDDVGKIDMVFAAHGDRDNAEQILDDHRTFDSDDTSETGDGSGLTEC